MLLQFTAGVTGAGVGVDSAWEQKILKARKMLAVGAARREAAVPSVQCTLCWAHRLYLPYLVVSSWLPYG
jgi:hypothetical protein